MLENHPLSNTFGLRSVANYYCEITSLNDIKQALAFSKNKNIPIKTIGFGSNVLLDKSIDSVVIKIINKNWEIKEEDENEAIVIVDSGLLWHDFVSQMIENNLYGVENLALIPGTCGATPVQNISAYGVEISDYIESVHWYSFEDNRVVVLKNKECLFGYRSSIFKSSHKNGVILKVEFRLKKVFAPNLNYSFPNGFITEGIAADEVFAKIIEIRKSKLPDYNQIGNAGSFFVNPVINKTRFSILQKNNLDMPFFKLCSDSYKVLSGWLIEKAGWKGWLDESCRYGVHKNNALVLVNYDLNNRETSLDEILELANKIKKDIDNRFGISLEIEPNIWK